MYVQAVLFDRDSFNLTGARAWLTRWGYAPLKFHVTTNYIRARIEEPSRAHKYRIVEFRPGVKAVIGFP
jgi:hypothetical protein